MDHNGIAKKLTRIYRGKDSIEFGRVFVYVVIREYWKAFRSLTTSKCSWDVRPLFAGIGRLPMPDPDVKKLASGIVRDIPTGDPIAAGYQIGCLFTSLLPADYRARHGVYYTPPSLSARLLDMVEAAGIDWKSAKVLDPACGGGAFLAPVAVRMLKAFRRCTPENAFSYLQSSLKGFEIDPFAAWMSQVFVDAVTLELCVTVNQRLPILIEVKDALAEFVHDVNFDLVVGNPPYARTSLSSHDRNRFQRSLYGHANLYGLFTDQALRLVREGGLVGYVTPTSFLAGQYFKNLRSLLGAEAPPRKIDFVEDRSGIFGDVLQETLLAVYEKANQIKTGETNLLRVRGRGQLTVVPIGRFVLPANSSEPWMIPRNPEQSALVRHLEKMSHRLHDYGYRVSTGPLVWNRHKKQLCSMPGPDRYPLIWAEAVTADGQFLFRADKKNHEPFFEIKEGDHWLMVDRSCLLLQRTTAKEQNRRLIAAELPRSFIKKHGAVVVENHLNMVYPANGNPKVSTKVMALLFNSRIVDQAFRCINGSVAVSAYELESLPLPPPAVINQISQLAETGASKESIEKLLERSYCDEPAAAAA